MLATNTPLPHTQGFQRSWDVAVPKPPWLADVSDDDVLCGVRRFVSDKDWAQPPVVVIPQGGLSRLLTCLPVGLVPRVFSPEKSEQWRKAAQVVERFVGANPTYLRAVAYLTALAAGACAVGAVLPDLPWHALQDGGVAGAFVVPLGLQGAMLPHLRFQAVWKTR